MQEELAVRYIDITIIPQYNCCISRFIEGGTMISAQLVAPLVFGKIAFTSIYRDAAARMSQCWHDGGQSTHDLLWVYVNNLELRQLYRPESNDDSQALFAYLRMFGNYGHLSTVMVAESGEHYIVSWDNNHNLDIRLVDTPTVVGDFGIMPLSDFREKLFRQATAHLDLELREMTTLKTDN